MFEPTELLSRPCGTEELTESPGRINWPAPSQATAGSACTTGRGWSRGRRARRFSPLPPAAVQMRHGRHLELPLISIGVTRGAQRFCATSKVESGGWRRQGWHRVDSGRGLGVRYAVPVVTITAGLMIHLRRPRDDGGGWVRRGREASGLQRSPFGGRPAEFRHVWSLFVVPASTFIGLTHSCLRQDCPSAIGRTGAIPSPAWRGRS